MRTLAARFGVDLDGITIRIIDDRSEDADYIRYLDYEGACACTPPELGGSEIHLGPASFFDEATLARTLVHERVHVSQLRLYGRPDSLQRLQWEQEADESEGQIALEGGQ